MSKGLSPPPPPPPLPSEKKGSKKNPPVQPLSTPTHTTPSDALRRVLHQSRHIDSSFIAVAVFSVSALCLLCFFFFFLLDRPPGVEVLKPRQKGARAVGVLDFGSEEGRKECDLFDGKWVWDDGYPLYESRDCGFLDDGFRCSENGRPESFYTKWRWQPRDCDLPRFDANDMLKRLRNRRLVFVGDSIGRNQWESLLCMLSSAISNKSSIYEVNGSPITKHNGFLVFKFDDYNCTIEYYRAPFLVVQGRPPRGVSAKVITTLRLDTMDWTSSRWKSADVLVFNTGHWWNYEKTIRSGCYFQEGGDVKMEMSITDAYRRSIETLVDWIHKKVNTTKTQVIYRTYSPVHFSGGDWKSGGSCHLETTPDLEIHEPRARPWAPMLNTFRSVLTEVKGVEVDVLNVSELTDRRKDGHMSIYYMGPGKSASIRRQDCSHWCLPGVPDTWNELLYALFVRQETSNNHDSGSIQGKGL